MGIEGGNERERKIYIYIYIYIFIYIIYIHSNRRSNLKVSAYYTVFQAEFEDVFYPPLSSGMAEGWSVTQKGKKKRGYKTYIYDRICDLLLPYFSAKTSALQIES